MKIKQIAIENFRLLKNFHLDLEDELSLVIGKNNSGKTSILTALEKFLNGDKSKFTLDDFNIDFKKEICKLLEADTIPDERDFKDAGLKLRLIIQYFESDDLSNVSKVMMDLDPDNNFIILGFDYVLTHAKLQILRNRYSEFNDKELYKEKLAEAKKQHYQRKTILYFLKSNLEQFTFRKRSIEFDKATNSINENNFIDLDAENIKIKDIINFKHIHAKREVTNKDIDKTLSRQTSRIYVRTETDSEQDEKIDKFKDELASTDIVLTNIYQDLFSKVVEKVSVFGGLQLNDSIIEIISTLQHRELLEGNTTVVYTHDDDKLPENYNGLGYMNLISMIFEIEILVEEFKKSAIENPSDINLLFIEEPEAHTHPQMQYVFIKNIKNLLSGGIIKKIKVDGGEEIVIMRELQYIITTHSSHIVAESNFDDIKYLKKTTKNSVISKNLKSLQEEYIVADEQENYKFLKQYLTLNRAELFFADKVIFIEGDTERILLPAMMKKIDQEESEKPLLSQNISIIEVGAHSHIFEKFIDFLGIKSLIITDIDTFFLEPDLDDNLVPKQYKNGKQIFKSVKCPADHLQAEKISNNSLKFFHNGNDNLNYYKELSFDWKILRKNRKKKWVSNKKGNLIVLFQISENAYHGRSFEDSFCHLNRDFIIDAKNSFNSLTKKYLELYVDGNIDDFEFYEKAINSKPSFAIEILLNSKSDDNGNHFTNWTIPAYIKEGLLWLKK